MSRRDYRFREQQYMARHASSPRDGIPKGWSPAAIGYTENPFNVPAAARNRLADLAGSGVEGLVTPKGEFYGWAEKDVLTRALREGVSVYYLRPSDRKIVFFPAQAEVGPLRPPKPSVSARGLPASLHRRGLKRARWQKIDGMYVESRLGIVIEKVGNRWHWTVEGNGKFSSERTLKEAKEASVWEAD